MKDLKPEPWMIEFVKGRHTQEERDAFYVYMEAGPVKRFFMDLGMVFAQILRFLR